MLKPLNNECSILYRPASAGFGGQFEFKQAVPDVDIMTSQMKEN